MSELLGGVELRRKETPGTLELEVTVRFGASWYTDINDVAPAWGFTGPDGGPVPGLAFTGEDGKMHVYALQANVLEMIRAAVSTDSKFVELLGKVLDGDEEAVAHARGLVEVAALDAAATAPTEETPDAA